MSAEYGWTDEDIWELPLCRLQQITAAIQRRRYLKSREENGRFSWMARMLAGYIAAGYMVGEGKENPAIKQAATIAFDEIEAAMLGAAVEPTGPAKFADPNAPRPTAPDIDPIEAMERAAAQNKTGSFAQFMQMNQSLEQRGRMI